MWRHEQEIFMYILTCSQVVKQPNQRVYTDHWTVMHVSMLITHRSRLFYTHNNNKIPP